MKKITISVAALLIAGISYAQSPKDYDKENFKTFRSIEYQIDDIIDAIRMDMHYGHLDQDRGMFYINEVIKIKSKNRDIMADLYVKRFNKIATK
tara:strand:- start:503 stop:784 length:282 start_codon:yes stop_codon:yes gene_type:complete